MTVPLRAALYLRVSTARQPSMMSRSRTRNGRARLTVQSRGHQLVETYVEPGASATNDRRPCFPPSIR
jgi:DNA invertase Pin-like site-specific DNA recombinase